MDFKYDVIVIGAGHAGCEAAAGQPIWAQRPA
jgi:tRNA U34 5-carboxymethylaminomethyl modifying enzyme MnmG/GidA